MDMMPAAGPQARSCFLAIVMERAVIQGEWGGEKWLARSAVCDGSLPGAPRRVLVERDDLTQILFPGCRIELTPKESEGYLLNVSSPRPKIFVMWRMHDGLAHPDLLSVSYHEGARWMDNEENVDSVPLPEALRPWIAAFADAHYVPEKKGGRYATNKDKGRMGHF